MKGLVLFPDSSYRLEEVPEPKLGENIFAPDDVLIEVELCGICGSDVHHLGDKSGLAGPPKPVVTGHEITGTVCGVGSGITRLAAGDRVVCEIVTFYCGHCVNCRAGLHNICINTSPMYGRAHYITGGGFAPLIVWPERHVHRLPDSISFKEAVLLEPTAGAVHTLVERLKMRPGESVCILGPGARGLIMTQMARALGGDPIMVTGVGRDVAARLPMALEMGADATLNAEEDDVLSYAMEMTDGAGFDVVVENTGSPSAVGQALDLARPGGRIVIAGGGIRGGISTTIDTRKLIVKELDVLGEISHNWTSWRMAISLVKQAKINLKPLLSNIYPLWDWETAFEAAAESERVFRVALSPGSTTAW